MLKRRAHSSVFRRSTPGTPRANYLLVDLPVGDFKLQISTPPSPIARWALRECKWIDELKYNDGSSCLISVFVLFRFFRTLRVENSLLCSEHFSAQWVCRLRPSSEVQMAGPGSHHHTHVMPSATRLSGAPAQFHADNSPGAHSQAIIGLFCHDIIPLLFHSERGELIIFYQAGQIFRIWKNSGN